MGMKCQKPEYSDKLIPFIEKSLPPEELKAISDHIKECPHCSNEVKNLTEVLNALCSGSKKVKKAWVHPEPEELLAWLQNNPDMSIKESSKIASHIAKCSLCQDEIKLLGEAPIISGQEEVFETSPMPESLKQAWQSQYGHKTVNRTAPNGFAAILETLRTMLFASRRFSYVAIIFIMIFVTGILIVKGPVDTPQTGSGNLVAVNNDPIVSPGLPDDFTPVLKGDGRLPGNDSPEYPLTGMTGVNGAMAPNNGGITYASDMDASVRFETAFMGVDQNSPGGPEWSDPNSNPANSGQPATLQDPDDPSEPPISAKDLKEREDKTSEIQKQYTRQLTDIIREDSNTAGFRVQVFATLSPFKENSGRYSIRSLTIYIEHPGALKQAEKTAIEDSIRTKMGFSGNEIFIFDPMY
jgi:hypothetical protein